MPLVTICKLAGISVLLLNNTVCSSIENVMGLCRHQRVFTLNNSFRGRNSFMQLNIWSLCSNKFIYLGTLDPGICPPKDKQSWLCIRKLEFSVFLLEDPLFIHFRTAN